MRRMYLAVLSAVFLILGVAATAVARDVQPEDLSRHVNPLIGTLAENCIIGPVLPHGSIHPSPQTPDVYPVSWLSPGNDGYSPLAPIVGFAQLHAQGTGGVASYGQLLLSPQIGLEIAEDRHASSKSEEVARIGRYAVTLDRYGIRCEVSPAPHAALYRFVFPEGVTPTLVFNAGRKINGPSLVSGHLALSSDRREITGSGLYAGNWMPGEYPLHYCLRVSVAPSGWGTFRDGVITPVTTDVTRDGGDPTSSFGAYLHFPAGGPREILVKIAVSFSGVDRARDWLDDEIPDWDLDRLEGEAVLAWNQALSRIAIEGASEAQAQIFYTALCRTMTQPRERTGDVPGYDGVRVWDDHYTLWDTYRTLWPLMTLIQPDLVRSTLTFFRHVYEQNGRVQTAFIWGRSYPADHQGGTEIDNLIADAVVKGIEIDDWCGVLDIARHDADEERTASYRERGYVIPEELRNPGSASLALAHNDFCVGQAASALGHADAPRYLARAASWRNLWNPDATWGAFTGFILPRTASGGFFGEPASSEGFYEDTSWSYSFFVPHDIHALIAEMGAPERFVERLERGYAAGFYHVGNQTAFLIPWLFVYAGRPDLCAEHVRDVIAGYTVEHYPELEDGGSIGSRFIFCAAGLYPNAGQPIYLLHGPLFARMTFRLQNGEELVIEGENAGEENLYVQSATLDGLPLERAWITHDEIAGGATLRFVMGSSPSEWGRAILPPSPLLASPHSTDCSGAEPAPPVAALSVLPRPARGSATIWVSVAAGGESLELTVHDAQGRRLRRLAHGRFPGGRIPIVWNGRDDRGRDLGPGVYFCRLIRSGVETRGRIVLVD